MLVKYAVRFRYYRYNCGRGDNGSYTHTKTFDTLEEARAFARTIPQRGESHEWLWDNFHIDGFVERYLGIYKITEEEVANVSA